MTGLLLDTHVVLWWLQGSPRVRPHWVEAVVDADNVVSISAASVWEIEIKKRAGKLDVPFDVIELSEANGFELLSISAGDARLAGSLEWDHRDPFDRMLAAQSLERGMTIVTDDAALIAAPGIRTL
jgi:PIN domain nuclease of toxin-antitoxin system